MKERGEVVKPKKPKNATGRQRWRLWHEDPRCFWCQIVTTLETRNGEPPAESLATIDHLRPRHHPGRLAPLERDLKKRHVLACWKCNNERDILEYNSLSLKELQARSAQRGRKRHASRGPGIAGLVKRYKRRIKRLLRAFRPIPAIWAGAANVDAGTWAKPVKGTPKKPTP